MGKKSSKIVDTTIIEEKTLDQDIAEAISSAEPKFNYKGKEYTRKSFIEAQTGVTEANVDMVIANLEAAHLLYWLDRPSVDKDLESAIKQAQVQQDAHHAEQEREAAETYAIMNKRRNVPTHRSVHFDFPTYSTAQNFKIVVNNMRIESKIESTMQVHKVFVFNITEQDLRTLTRVYKSNNFIEAASRRVDKFTNNTVATADYVSRNIVAPVSKSAFNCAVKTGSVAISGIARILASGVIAISQGIQEGANAIKQDTEITAARAEFINAKNTIANKWNDGYGSDNGIHIDD